MKCSEVKNFFQPLLDNEIELANKLEIKAHIDVCDLCRVDFETLQTTQKLLKKQPPILPTMSFDNRVLQAFENRKTAQQESKKSWFAGLFAIPKPALAFAVGLFALALGLTFLLGRMSVATTTQIVMQPTPNVENKQDEPLPQTVNPKKEEVAMATPEVRTVTKIVQVPVVKEKIVERIVYVTKPNQNKGIENIKIKNPPTIAQNDNIASQFNLKTLKPVMNVTYQIIKKGENNED